MQSKEARKKFKLADSLFREKKYAEALDLLDELDATFPNAKNVMYPKAMCLAKLGRPHEAHELCQKLKAIYNDPRADKLMEKLAAGAQPPPLPTAPGADMAFEPVDLNLDDISAPGGADPLGLDDLFAAKPAAPAAPPPPEPPSRKTLYIGLGIAGGVVLILLLTLPLLLGGGDQAESEEESAGLAGQTSEAAPEIRWYSSRNAATNAIGERLVPTVIFFYSADDDSTRMITDTWKDPSIAYLIKDWYCVRINAEEDPEALSNYEVESFPYTVIEDEGGYLVYAEGGFLSASKLYEAIQQRDLNVYVPPEITAFTAIILLLLALAQSAGGLYLTLLIVKKLPHDEFLKDIISVSLVGIGASAVAGLCPCVGVFIAIYILHKAYELELLDFVALIAINMILGLFTTVLAAAIMGVPYSELVEIVHNY